MRHRRTDPACTEHRPPRTWWQRVRYERARGLSCGVCLPSRGANFEHDARLHAWMHPETGVTIACEQMPTELVPTSTHRDR